MGHTQPLAPTTDTSSRTPLMELLVLAAPVAATMVSYTIAQFVDGLMVSRLGAAELAAQGNGGIIAFVPIAITLGALSVVNTYVSQNSGAGRPERAPMYAWNGVWLGVLFWLIVLVPAALCLRWLLVAGPSLTLDAAGLLGMTFERDAYDPRVFELQTSYARILLLGAVFTISARAIAQFFYGMHAPMTVFVAALCGNIVNVVVNYALIFGNFGMPQLGVVGAAIGTVIGSMVEAAIPMAIFLGPAMHRKFKTRSAWRPRLAPMRDILKIGWPAGVTLGNELVCWAIFMTAILASIGVADNAAGWIGLRYMHLSFMPAVGISIAVTAMVGKCIGMGRPDLAVKRAWLGVRVSIVYMGFCAACFVIFREPMVRLFIDPNAPPEMAEDILRIGSQIMICAALFQIFDALGITLVGALRGAGDTVWPGVATVIMAWTFIIGGGWAMLALFPDLRALGPWIAAAAFITVFAGVMAFRFMGGRWRSIDLLNTGGPDAPPPTDGPAAAILGSVAGSEPVRGPGGPGEGV
ncbi:MAG: MATE family efflux transporter [Phycisphaerales bacterium]|nr:MAG: MATE family efflux transporter [Phycisphaerales bacterium]